jgi:hypothetical protein
MLGCLTFAQPDVCNVRQENMSKGKGTMKVPVQKTTESASKRKPQPAPTKAAAASDDKSEREDPSHSEEESDDRPDDNDDSSDDKEAASEEEEEEYEAQSHANESDSDSSGGMVVVEEIKKAVARHRFGRADGGASTSRTGMLCVCACDSELVADSVFGFSCEAEDARSWAQGQEEEEEAGVHHKCEYLGEQQEVG